MGVLLPSSVPAVKRGFNFDFVGEGKESAGEVESGLDVLWRDAVVAEGTTLEIVSKRQHIWRGKDSRLTRNRHS